MLMIQSAITELPQDPRSRLFSPTTSTTTTIPQSGASDPAQRRLHSSPQNGTSTSSSARLASSDRASPNQSASPYSSSAAIISLSSAMNGIAGTAPTGAMYVRALYDYEADDRTSLSFHEGDVIQVITQLESGWWDGVINGVRGWFPSNYCQLITSPDELPETEQNGVGAAERLDGEFDDDVYEDDIDDEDDDDPEDISGLPLEGTDMGSKSGADFWIPQATPDGRLFYYNTMTGESSMELPLESPTTATETGPRDRMNISVPERTRPPPELMASGGFQQDEDEDSEVNSASEMEGESIMMASRGSAVRLPCSTPCTPLCLLRQLSSFTNIRITISLEVGRFRTPHLWTR